MSTYASIKHKTNKKANKLINYEKHIDSQKSQLLQKKQQKVLITAFDIPYQRLLRYTF